MIQADFHIYGATQPMTPLIGEQVAQLFAENYPVSHDEASRSEDIQTRGDTDTYNRLLAEPRTLYVAQFAAARTVGIAGILESRTVEQGEGTIEQLSWIVVDERFRGQGISSGLHRLFEAGVAARAAARAPKPTAQLLSVHTNNPTQEIYKKWGYELTGGRTADGQKLFMIKRV